MKFIFFIFFLFSTSTSAGVLVEPQAKWHGYVFAPEDDEKTYNYYGYGLGIGIGYSVFQVIDFALFGNYLPGKRDQAGVIDPHAVSRAGGLEVALRISKSLYIATRGGMQTYQLRKQKFDEEIPGYWQGPMFGGSLGFMTAIEKSNFWQLSFDFSRAVMSRKDEEDQTKRFMDTFGLSLTFVYNDSRSSRFDKTLFGSYFDGMF